MNWIIVIISVPVTAALSLLVAHFVAKAKIAALQAKLDAADALIRRERELHDKALSEIEKSNSQLLSATRNELALENEKQLKLREKALVDEAQRTMRDITGLLDKDIRQMKEAFDAQKKSHSEDNVSLKTKFDETVNMLRLQTESIGSQAADLANALKGRNKMQGIFGETILENLLIAEGLKRGRDYDCEFWLRDRDGNLIVNEDSGRRMRPDVALHFPDETDILVDAKISLTALSDYFSATDDEQRKAASARNLESVRSHIRELNDKEYQKFVRNRKSLDYVIMFIPNYGAYQLAKQENPNIFTEAFQQNVLITTEETLVPFLRLIRTAWVQKSQVENMKAIVDGARKMLDRVAIFCEKNAEVENHLRQSLKLMEDNTKRLVEGRQSIVRAATEVSECGVELSVGKKLPQIKDSDI